jgi:hypothetical protein
MDKKQICRKSMLIGGIIELAIAVIHFLMPFQFIREDGFGCLSKPFMDFVLLATLAIGLCLIVFGILSLFLSERLLVGERSAWLFGLSQGILWLGRAFLEIVYPVKFKLFFLPNPTFIILILSLCLGFLFLIPTLAFKKEILS